jgi:hypothetical protein
MGETLDKIDEIRNYRTPVSNPRKFKVPISGMVNQVSRSISKPCPSVLIPGYHLSPVLWICLIIEEGKVKEGRRCPSVNMRPCIGL